MMQIELGRVDADGQAVRSGGRVVAREGTLSREVGLALAVEGKGMSRNRHSPGQSRTHR